MNEIVLSKDELTILVKLVHTAERTPVIALSSQEMLDGRDWASLAWKSVRELMDELGKKYGYDPMKMQINAQTGKVTAK
jgi:hypothetical protein